MLSPKDVVKEAGVDFLLPVIKQIDKVMIQFHGQFGWVHVYHKTSTECGDLSSLTMFIFSEIPLDINKVLDEHWTVV